MRTLIAVAIVTATLLIPQLCLADGAQQLFNVEREGKSTKTPVLVLTDANGDVTGLRVDRDNYSAAQLHSETLIHIDGVKDSDKVLYLSGANVDTKTGGTLTMRYLHDGVAGKYYTLALNLSRNENNTWTVKVAGKPIKALRMTNNTVIFIGTIGIEAVNPIFAYLASALNDDGVVALAPEAGTSVEKLSDAPNVKYLNTAVEAIDGGVVSADSKTPIGT